MFMGWGAELAKSAPRIQGFRCFLAAESDARATRATNAALPIR
jgi:hypothetical protein